jgi:predicted nucleic acid-binding protein
MDLLDTDVLIDVQRGHPPAVQWFSSLTELPVAPGFVIMELIQDARNGHEVQQALKLTAPLTVVWPSGADCNQALLDFARYHLSHGLGLLDSLIGACAVCLSADLCTFNEKHYRPITGLSTVQPYTR